MSTCCLENGNDTSSMLGAPDCVAIIVEELAEAGTVPGLILPGCGVSGRRRTRCSVVEAAASAAIVVYECVDAIII